MVGRENCLIFRGHSTKNTENDDDDVFGNDEVDSVDNSFDEFYSESDAE